MLKAIIDVSPILLEDPSIGFREAWPYCLLLSVSVLHIKGFFFKFLSWHWLSFILTEPSLILVGLGGFVFHLSWLCLGC